MSAVDTQLREDAPVAPIYPMAALIRFLAPWGRRLVVPVTLVLAWEAAVDGGWLDRNTLPAPSAVLRALADLAELGRLWPDIAASLGRIAVGFSLATVAGIALGSLLGWYRRLAEYLLPVIELIRPISVIAWIPIAILWFGLGNKSAWFLIFLGAFFPIFTNAFAGVRALAPTHLRVAQCLGVSRRQFVVSVLLPSALPLILTGMRIGLGTGWTCVIAAELIASTSGLGYMIQIARTMIETEKVLGGMLVIGLIGFAMNAAMVKLERWLTPWRTHEH